MRAWDGLTHTFRVGRAPMLSRVDLKDAFTAHNYQAFFVLTVEVLVRPWEKMISAMRFTEVIIACRRLLVVS